MWQPQISQFANTTFSPFLSNQQSLTAQLSRPQSVTNNTLPAPNRSDSSNYFIACHRDNQVRIFNVYVCGVCGCVCVCGCVGVVCVCVVCVCVGVWVCGVCHWVWSDAAVNLYTYNE